MIIQRRRMRFHDYNQTSFHSLNQPNVHIMYISVYFVKTSDYISELQTLSSVSSHQVLNQLNILNYSHIVCSVYIQGVTGGTDQTSGECSLGQTIPI